MLSNFFKKLQNQFLLLLLLSTIIPVTIVGWYGIFSSTAALSQLSLTQIDSQVSEKAEKISSFFSNFREDTLFLSKVPPIQGLVRARAGGGIDRNSNSSYADWVERLQTIFVAMIQAKPYYTELRFLDETGQELVRVDFDGVNIKTIPPNLLQNKSDRPHFRQAMKLGLNQIYVSGIELNQERGQIERPFKPVIRFATPIFDSAGTRKGVAIANVFANYLIKTIEEANLGKEAQLFLINQDGYYISHPDPSKEWGFDLKTNQKLEKDYPADITKQILKGDQGHIDKLAEHIISYYTIPLNSGQKESLTVVYQAPKQIVFASINRFTSVAGMIIFLTVLIVLPIGYFQVLKMVKLVKNLANGISDFSLEIFSTLEQQERIAAAQSSSVDGTTIAIAQISTSFKQTASEAENVAAGANQALKLAEEGTRSIEETLQVMLSLQEKVSVISQQAQLLGDSTSQIGNISTLANLVSDLANQTNILALNAAVEAVRAGDRGQGFAVVATEIRKLADESRAAAAKINAIVPEIQSAIKSTVKATDEGAKTLETGWKIARQASRSFSGVRDAANNVLSGNEHIFLNAKEQVSAIQEVVNAMNNINQGSAETTAGIRYTKIGVEKLNEQALNLKAII